MHESETVGTDIHLFLELRESGGLYRAVSDGEFALPRDYPLFCAMGGVRCNGERMRRPRGLPNDVTAEIATAYFVPVLSDETAAGWSVGDYFTPQQAARFVESGASVRKPDSCTDPIMSTQFGFISHPDRHSPSWLFAKELSETIASLPREPDESRRRIRQLLSFANTLEKDEGGPARFVFWFDN